MAAFDMFMEAGAIAIFLAPFAILVGAAVGSIADGMGGAVKEATMAQENETVINNALSELKIQETMAEHVLKTCKELEDYRFDLFKEQGPTWPGEKLTYEFLSEKGINTVSRSA